MSAIFFVAKYGFTHPKLHCKLILGPSKLEEAEIDSAFIINIENKLN